MLAAPMALAMGRSVGRSLVKSSDFMLDLNFLSGALDPRVTFTRASTATYFNSAGVMQTAAVDTPRFDYDPVTLQPRGLLIEGARTNLLLRSAEFATAPWASGAAGDAIVTANSGICPDGTNSAILLNDDSASVVKGRLQPVTVVSSGSQYTASVYAKASSSSVISVRLSLLGGTGVAGEVVVNLTSGAAQWRTGVTGVSYAIQSVGGGWYRVSVTIADNASGNNSLVLELRPAFSATYVPTLDVAATGAALFWGTQLEAGAFATSYIPTTSAAVTRAADVAVMTGANFSSWFNAAEGAFVVEASTVSDNSAGLFAVQNAGLTHFMRAARQFGKATALVNTAGVDQASLITANNFTSGAIAKSALAFAANDFSLCLNGGAIVSDAAGTVPTVDRLFIGSGGFSSALDGHLRRVRYYRTRLPNTRLQELTA